MPETPLLSLALESTVFNRSQLRDQLARLGDLPQIALAGRSNVGKSSLVNALARRKNLAKTSATPGKTRSVNFYRALAPESAFILVDLPGYGYARCSQSERQKWAQLIDDYFREASSLRALALLLDCRIPPQALDKDMAAFALSRSLTLIPILTKADKCSQAERSRRRHEWAGLLDGADPVPVSARTGLGLEALCARLTQACWGRCARPQTPAAGE